MSANLYLLLGDTPDAPLRWLRVNDAGSLLANGIKQNFSAFAQTNIFTGEERLVALLPGELAALRLLPSPPRSRTQFLSAARYLLEDSVAEDIDNLHVAIATRNKVGTQSAQAGLCLAVSKSLMEHWHRVFLEEGIFPSLMSVDFLGLPYSNDTSDHLELSLFVHHDGLLANGSSGGLAMDLETAEIVIDDIIEEWSPDHINLYADKNAISLNDETRVMHHPEANLSTLAALLHQGTVVANAIPNLLTGAFGRKINWRTEIAPWRGIAIAACFCAVAAFGAWALDGIRADRSANRYTDIARDIHQNAFPEVRNVDPVQHARQVLSTQVSDIGFLSIWLGFASAIEQHEGVQVDGFFFAGSGSDMRVTINVESQDSLNAFKATLEESGISAQEGRMNRNTNGQFAGELTVKL